MIITYKKVQSSAYQDLHVCNYYDKFNYIKAFKCVKKGATKQSPFPSTHFFML